MKIDDLSRILDVLHMPAACVLETGHLQAMNAAFRALYPGAETGRPYGLILRQPEVSAAVGKALDTGARQSAEFAMARGLRDLRWQVTAAPLAIGGRPAILLTFEDRTAAEESARIRRDFIANVSHELRSPLTALLGFIETLRGAARDDAAARDRFLAIMEGEAQRMKRLVQDLMSLSQVEADERVRPTGSVDLSAILGNVVDLTGPAAERAGVAIECRGLDAPIPIAGDSDQLTQVFANLVENAVKYGGNGGRIRIGAARIAHDPGLRAPAVRIEVTDFGDGFDPRHIPRLTERFYRIDSHRSREMGGTGLGLAIVKHIVNRHRGRLKIESAPGEGSRFSVFLPL